MSPTSVYSKHFINDALIALSYSHALFSAKSTSTQDTYDYVDNIFSDSIVCNYRNLQKTPYTLHDAISLMQSNKNNFNKKDIYCADNANFHHANTLLPENEYTTILQNIEV